MDFKEDSMGLEISKKDQKWAEETLEKVYAKMEQVRERSARKIPFRSDGGIHDDHSDIHGLHWWTNGFWGGLM